ncbi:MAG: hypothetical protein ACK55I_31345, partial [bacterium]
MGVRHPVVGVADAGGLVSLAAVDRGALAEDVAVADDAAGAGLLRVEADVLRREAEGDVRVEDVSVAQGDGAVDDG